MTTTPRLKICGITSERDATAATRAGARYVGFVFIPNAPDYITPQAAAKIIATLEKGVEAVGVFAGGSPRECRTAVETSGVKLIQLRGGVPPHSARAIKSACDRPLIQSIHIADRRDMASLADFDGIADYILCEFGSDGGDPPALDLTALDGAPLDTLFISGDVTPANVADVATIGAFGIDVNHGVESAPGEKDLELLDALSRSLGTARARATDVLDRSQGPEETHLELEVWDPDAEDDLDADTAAPPSARDSGLIPVPVSGSAYVPSPIAPPPAEAIPLAAPPSAIAQAPPSTIARVPRHSTSSRNPATAPSDRATAIHDAAERAKTEKQQTLKEAREKQQRLLPPLPQLDGVEVGVVFEPADVVAGSFYDFTTVFRRAQEGQYLGVRIGAITGKGLEVWGEVVVVMKTMRIYAKTIGDQPAEMLKAVNEELADDDMQKQLVTASSSVIDIHHKVLRTACAGFTPVYGFNMHRLEPFFALKPAGMALGLVSPEVFEKTIHEREFALHSGDLLVWTSEGIMEALNPAGEAFGNSRFVDRLKRYVMNRPQEVLDLVMADVATYTDGRALESDIIMIAVRIE